MKEIWSVFGSVPDYRNPSLSVNFGSYTDSEKAAWKLWSLNIAINKSDLKVPRKEAASDQSFRAGANLKSAPESISMYGNRKTMSVDERRRSIARIDKPPEKPSWQSTMPKAVDKRLAPPPTPPKKLDEMGDAEKTQTLELM